MCALPMELQTHVDFTLVPRKQKLTRTLTADLAEGDRLLAMERDSCFLVVDDSPIVLRITKRKLELYFGPRCRVDCAQNGLEAVDYVKNAMKLGTYSGISAIFMDHHMPVCTGLEAIRQIRVLEANQQLAPAFIAVVTADVARSTTSDFIMGGADCLLAKPTPESVLEELATEAILRSLHDRIAGSRK
jgi:CheY-like chemotaxis protein